ncbi:response regulator [Crocinitomicaceae bacterium]|jgi:CheY-like chemotaxis protein|nr:response regulator [Crocinitomicaceae bacterium]
MKKINILVAEDNLINQLLIKTILEKNNYNVYIAENGLLACEELRNNMNFYSIILMDIMMPVMNGFEATEKIRKSIDNTIPIIAVTADVTSNVKKKCFDIGMNDYMSKPFESSELIHMIFKHITH